MNLPKTSQKRIVIIGGGFGGISLAKKLKKLNAQIVLIDRHNYHTFQPLLYQVSTSGLEPFYCIPYSKSLKAFNKFSFSFGIRRKDKPSRKNSIHRYR